MKHPISTLAIATGVAIAASFGIGVVAPPVAAAGEGRLLGAWATGSDGGRVQIYRCGEALCGRIIGATALRTNPDQRDIRNNNPQLRNRRLMGLVILNGFTGGPTSWRGQNAYDPVSGAASNNATMTLRSDGRLAITGCVAVFCRTKIWTRV